MEFEFDLISPIEDAIIQRLEELTSKRVLVEPYPDNPETYEPTHPIGALLVRYTDGDYGDTKSTDLVVQDRDMYFEITLAMWSLRGRQGGIYAYSEAVRIGLTGFKPPNCILKLTPKNEGFVGRTTNVLKNKPRRLWQYQITFRTQTMNIEAGEEEIGPLLKRLTLEDNFDETTEIP